MVCEECKKEEVQMTSPRPLCRGCWYDWFTKGWQEPQRTENRAIFVKTGEIPPEESEE